MEQQLHADARGAYVQGDVVDTRPPGIVGDVPSGPFQIYPDSSFFMGNLGEWTLNKHIPNGKILTVSGKVDQSLIPVISMDQLHRAMDAGKFDEPQQQQSFDSDSAMEVTFSTPSASSLDTEETLVDGINRAAWIAKNPSWRPPCERCGKLPGQRVQCVGCHKYVGPGCTPRCLLVEFDNCCRRNPYREIISGRWGICVDCIAHNVTNHTNLFKFNIFPSAEELMLIPKNCSYPFSRSKRQGPMEVSTAIAELTHESEICSDWATAEPKYEDVWIRTAVDNEEMHHKASFKLKDGSIRAADGTYLNTVKVFNKSDQKTDLGVILNQGKFYREWLITKCPDYADDYLPGTGRIFNIQLVELAMEDLKFNFKKRPTVTDQTDGGQSSSSLSHTAIMGGNTITIQQNVSINRGGRDNDQDEPEEEDSGNPDRWSTRAERRGIPNDNLLRIPTRAIVIGYSVNLHARSAEDRENLIYPQRPDMQKILHINPRCGGMQDAQIHYIPGELAHMIRWCRVCAQNGRKIKMPSYCPCCDENLNQPINTSDATVEMDRYVMHVASCPFDQHSGVPVPANSPTSPCHRDFQTEILKECEGYADRQRERKQAGYAPRMTNPLWARYMLGRLPIWMNKFPNLG